MLGLLSDWAAYKVFQDKRTVSNKMAVKIFVFTAA